VGSVFHPHRFIEGSICVLTIGGWRRVVVGSRRTATIAHPIVSPDGPSGRASPRSAGADGRILTRRPSQCPRASREVRGNLSPRGSHVVLPVRGDPSPRGSHVVPSVRVVQ